MAIRSDSWFTENGIDPTQVYSVDDPAPIPYNSQPTLTNPQAYQVQPDGTRVPVPAITVPAAQQAVNTTEAQYPQNAAVGHDGTYRGMTREQYRDAWMSSGAHTLQDLQNFVQQHGGQVVSDSGNVMTPYGEQINMLIGAQLEYHRTLVLNETLLVKNANALAIVAKIDWGF